LIDALRGIVDGLGPHAKEEKEARNGQEKPGRENNRRQEASREVVQGKGSRNKT
jgi:hypothetical protein